MPTLTKADAEILSGSIQTLRNQIPSLHANPTTHNILAVIQALDNLADVAHVLHGFGIMQAGAIEKLQAKVEEQDKKILDLEQSINGIKEWRAGADG